MPTLFSLTVEKELYETKKTAILSLLTHLSQQSCSVYSSQKAVNLKKWIYTTIEFFTFKGVVFLPSSIMVALPQGFNCPKILPFVSHCSVTLCPFFLFMFLSIPIDLVVERVYRNKGIETNLFSKRSQRYLCSIYAIVTYIAQDRKTNVSTTLWSLIFSAQ